MEPIEKLLSQVRERIDESRERFSGEAEKVMGRLSLEIAEAVIGEAAMKSSGELLEYNLKRCLDVLTGSGEVIIKINPGDYDHARDKVDSVFERNEGKFNFKFEPDPSISPGGCYIETPGGSVDGRIESQFKLIKENFQQMI